MEPGATPTRDVLVDLLVGGDRSRTRRALALAVGYFVVSSGLAATLQQLPYEAVPRFVFGIQNAFRIPMGTGPIHVVPTRGVVVVVGLAAIHAYLNAGYLTSLALAAAPVYPHILFTVPGPRTALVVPLSEEVVFAPLWAAMHVLPEVVAFATLGFGMGMAVRHLRRRRATTANPT